jgi:hypothetical protein
VPTRTRARSTTKIGSKNSLYTHMNFTEHLVGALEKSPQENDLNQEPSSLLIRWLKNLTSFTLQQFTLKWNIDTPLQTVCRTLGEHTQGPNARIKQNLNRVLTGALWECEDSKSLARTANKNWGWTLAVKTTWPDRSACGRARPGTKNSGHGEEDIRTDEPTSVEPKDDR